MSAGTLAQERNVWRIYALEAKAELLKALRLPMYAVPTLAFPLVFYLLFGVAMRRGPAASEMATYLLATYGCFGVIGASLFGFGVGVAVERGQGWMLFKRATPMPPLAHLVGKLAMCLLFSAILVVALFALGIAFGGVSVPLGTLAALAAVLVAGAVPFGAFGLALGYAAGPNSAPAVINLIYLPLAFASGLWIPVDVLPSFFQKLAPWLPPYHYSQLALGVLGKDQGGSVLGSLAVLVLFTLLSLTLARAGYRRDEGKTFG
jgi:ABC-2 type transport system permease protein